MPSRQPLSEWQLRVLGWIDEGCPDSVMVGFTYKTTAIALQGRRLVKVSKRGGQWRAETTDAGRHYLAHGTYPDPSFAGVSSAREGSSRQPTPPARTPLRQAVRPQRQQAAARPSAPKSKRAKTLSPTEQLVADVLAAGGRLVVQRDGQRSGYDYEQLIANAHRYDKLPVGKRLTSKALSWPEMEIRLVDAPPGTEVALRAVRVPPKVARYHPAVARFRGRTDRHEVSAGTLSRASRFIHALLVEAERRGYEVAHVGEVHKSYGSGTWTGAQDGHFKVTINGHSYSLRIRESGLPSRAHWQRTHYGSREKYPSSGSGSLEIELCGYSREGRPTRWGDRKTWTLEDKLPDVLREQEIRAAEDEHARREAERAAAERKRRWVAAMEQAKADLTEAHRAEHLSQQAERWRQARHLREYLAAMADTVQRLQNGQDRDDAGEWLAWSRVYVERLDPLNGKLTMPEPPKPHT